MMAAAVMAQRSAFDPIKLAKDFQRIFTLFMKRTIDEAFWNSSLFT